MTKIDTNNLIASKELCDYLGIDRSTLSRWVSTGRIKPALELSGRTGPRWFYKTDVDKLLPKPCPECGQLEREHK